MEVDNTPGYRVMCRFALFVALGDHNPPTLLMFRQMDSHHVSGTACRAKTTLDGGLRAY